MLACDAPSRRAMETATTLEMRKRVDVMTRLLVRADSATGVVARRAISAMGTEVDRPSNRGERCRVRARARARPRSGHRTAAPAPRGAMNSYGPSPIPGVNDMGWVELGRILAG